MTSSNYIEQKKNTHLYFQIGDNKYAINSDNVLEIMKLPALDYPQKLPNNIVGLLKYNNFVINVIDVRFYLDIEVKPYNTHNELLIVKTDETIFGIITDKVIGIIPFNSSMIDSIPYVDNRTIVDSLYKFNNETIFIINIYAIENILKEHNVMPDFDMKSLFSQDEASSGLLAKRTFDIAKKSNMRLVSGELHTKSKFISFKLNDVSYCIPLDSVKEVLKDTAITPIPGTPNYIEGIMNLRGDYITVLNLKKFLDFPQDTVSDKNPVIIIESNELTLALLIDKINELFDYQEDGILNAGDSYFAGEFIYNETLYTVLNIEKIASDKKIIITDM